MMALILCERHSRGAGEHVSRQLACALAAGGVQPTVRVELRIEDMDFPAAVLASEIREFEALVGGTFDETGRMEVQEEWQLDKYLGRLTAVCMECLNAYRGGWDSSSA